MEVILRNVESFYVLFPKKYGCGYAVKQIPGTGVRGASCISYELTIINAKISFLHLKCF
jgi:hypothetical protein